MEEGGGGIHISLVHISVFERETQGDSSDIVDDIGGRGGLGTDAPATHPNNC